MIDNCDNGHSLVVYESEKTAPGNRPHRGKKGQKETENMDGQGKAIFGLQLTLIYIQQEDLRAGRSTVGTTRCKAEGMVVAEGRPSIPPFCFDSTAVGGSPASKRTTLQLRFAMRRLEGKYLHTQVTSIFLQKVTIGSSTEGLELTGLQI